MIIGLSGFGDNTEAFETFNIVNNFNRIELTKMKADELSIKEETNIAIEDESKEEWHYTQILLALFEENLEAGNVSLNGMPIEFIKIKKRKKEDLIWNEVKHVPFDKNVKDYYYIDPYVSALDDYEYAVQPIGAGGVAGNNIYNEIEVDFDGAWLIDKEKQYKLLYNLEIGDYETVIPSTVVETLDSQYPYVLQNGNIKYRKGSLQCMLVSDSTINGYGLIDRKQEKRIRENIMSFLTNKKPKLYKDSSGMMMVIMLDGNPRLIPRNDLSQRIYELSIDFIEIADTDTQSLIDNGLLEL